MSGVCKSGIIAKKMGSCRYSVLQVGRWLFVHGGIAPETALKYSLNDINTRFPNINIFSGSVNRTSKGSTIIDITTNPYSTLRQGDGIENSNQIR